MISISFNGIALDINMKIMLFINLNNLHTKNKEKMNQQIIKFSKNKHRSSKESKSFFKNWDRYYETKVLIIISKSIIHIIFCRIKICFQKYFI